MEEDRGIREEIKPLDEAMDILSRGVIELETVSRQSRRHAPRTGEPVKVMRLVTRALTASFARPAEL